MIRMFRVRDEFRQAQLAIAALFLFLGFQYGTWASRLPTIKSKLDLSEAKIGLLLMACGVGAAVSFPLVAMLMRRMGSRRVCCDGVAVGCLNVAMNAQGAALEVKYERTAMARFHAAFSGGALLAALIASGMNVMTSSLAAHFAVAAAILLLLVAYARSALLTEDPQQAPEKSRRKWTVPSRVTIWMGCAMAFGTVTEGAMNDWSALYMKDVVNAASAVAPLGIAVVSVMMVVARLFADGWRTRWGDGRIVRVGSALAGAGLALALLVGGVVPALIGFACVGLGVAAVTPCIYVAAARQGSDALALVAAMGTTGLLAGPATIGFIASASSLVWGMGAVAISAVLVSVCATQIRWTTTTKTLVEA
jgi:predicted MFS family arabinose efflux permease